MSRLLPSAIIGGVASALALLNLIFWSALCYPLVLLKVILPIRPLRRLWECSLMHCAEGWISGNNLIERLTQDTIWEVRGLDDLSRDGHFLLCVNHQSLVDIVVLQRAFNRRMPFLKFFIKQELIWTPLLGLIWWGLDFPFMKRYTKEQIERRPELKGKDLETTQRKCEHFCAHPFSIINFLEGTRLTPEKHAQQQSPYTHLLKPKAGGVAFVLAAVQGRVDTLLDVTIAYASTKPTFWEFLCSRIPKIIVSVRQREVPADLLRGDYLNDADYRERFQAWVRQLWQDKDLLLGELLEEVRV